MRGSSPLIFGIRQKEKGMYQVCIFDLDGTLTDTLDSLEVSVNDTLKEMGLNSIDREDVRAYVGNGVRVLMQKSFRK